MDASIFYDPLVTPATIAVAGSLAAIALLWVARKSIAAAIDTASRKVFTRSGLFWAVNLVFMGVSVLHAGVFFGITGSYDLTWALGFAVSFFLDLVTVILMQAMLESRYRGEDGRARQFLFFIVITCGTSTFANLAISLNDFNADKMLHNAPTWVQVAAPYVLASFPLFVIMMSIAAEMIVNLRPLESLDTEEYEADELKRITILQIRNTYLERQAIEERRALEIRATMRANKQQHKPVLTLPRFRQSKIDIDAIQQQIAEQLKQDYDARMATLQRQFEEVLAASDSEVNEVFRRSNYCLKESYADNDSSGIPPTMTEKSGPLNTFVDPVINGPQSPLGEASQNHDNDAKCGSITALSVSLKWQKEERKSVSLKDIAEATGLSMQKLSRAKKHFARTPQGAGLYRIPSVVKWLETAL